MNNKRITVKVTEQLHRAVRVKAALEGRPVSVVVRELLKEWTRGEGENAENEHLWQQNAALLEALEVYVAIADELRASIYKPIPPQNAPAIGLLLGDGRERARAAIAAAQREEEADK